MTDTVFDRVAARWAEIRQERLKAVEEAPSNQFLREALAQDKREGLLLAVRARWAALAVFSVLIIYLQGGWQAIYYEAILLGFAVLGWLQLRVGKVGHSRRELFLMFCDLALLTFCFVVPNPLYDDVWPTAMQYRFANFPYFFVLLAAATLAYSWRTVLAFGTWTTVLWLGGLVFVVFFGSENPTLGEAVATALTGHERLSLVLDPNSPLIPNRIQEVVVFLVTAGILALNGRRNSLLLLRQAEVARERANLARHFPPNIVDRIASRDQPLGSVRAQPVAVMFADIVGFTPFAESSSPQVVVAMLREFHGRLEAAVFDNHGTLDKFLGDGIMATFGTPDVGPDDARNALRCARDMLAAIADWNVERAGQGQEAIRLSIGIHYGEVILGDIGSARRLEFAALGDTVNVANRLEALTREKDSAIIISDALVQAIYASDPQTDGAVLENFRAEGEQTLRGRADPVAIWSYARPVE